MVKVGREKNIKKTRTYIFCASISSKKLIIAIVRKNKDIIVYFFVSLQLLN